MACSSKQKQRSMKKNIFSIGFFLLAAVHLSVNAQTTDSSLKTFRIGIFAPLYFDSVFNGAQYKYDKQMPKIVLPGLEFVEGAQIALDTIATNNSIKAFVYDIKSKEQNINSLLNKNSFDSLDLIIGSANGSDYKQLAEIAVKKNIPFISATYPNDGGITNNPFTVILNATLNTHCTAVYNYINKTAPTSKMVLFRKAGSTEDRITAQFTKLNAGNNGKPLFNIPSINLPDSFTVADILSKLDSTRTNTIIAGSLDEIFGKKLAAICAGVSKKYTIILMGVPTWDGIKDFTKPEFKNFPIYYPANYYNTETDQWSNTVNSAFKIKTSGKAMDMVFKGFECTYYFLSLLIKDKTNFMNNLNDKTLKIFTDYDFKPVRINAQSISPDYFENKRVYILKKLNGVITKVY